jgi:hypothetical protein
VSGGVVGFDRAAPGAERTVVERVGFRSGRPSWDWLTRPAWEYFGSRLEQLANVPPELALLLFGVVVYPSPIVRLDEAPPPSRRREPRRTRTALGSGVIRVAAG